MTDLNVQGIAPTKILSLMNFNESQLAVIRCRGNALIYASAGTGKTFTLAEKIRLSILEDKVDPSSILCLTFTNRGCEEIRKKVSENVDEKHFQQLTIKTFHAFCYELINEYHISVNNQSLNSIIFDEDDCRVICKDILEEKKLYFHFKDDFDGLNRIISYMKDSVNKNGLFTGLYLESIKTAIKKEYEENKTQLNYTFRTLFPNNIGVLSNTISATLLYEIMERYQKELELSHAFDFNDLVYYANRYILNESFRKKIANKYKWIYIDESQDTSFNEYSLIKKIATNSKVVLSGDFFQTIYEWRGSNPEQIIKDFKNTYNPEIFCYNINYRSTKTIALASFSILKKMFPDAVDDIYEKEIMSANNKDGELIQINECFMDQEEAKRIHRDVLSHPNDDACILVRTNRHAKIISELLQKLNPDRYFLVQDYQYYKRPEVKEILAFLRLILNPYDSVSLERIAAKYIKGFGDIKLQRLTSKETYNLGIRIADLLDKKTHDFNGDTYGCLIKNIKNNNVVVFDTETTGLNVDNDEIIQIACRKIDKNGNELDRFVTLVKTNKGVGDSIKVHHISDEELQRNGVSKIDALTKFIEFTKGSVLVGQNVTFDISIMNSELERVGLPIIGNTFYDTLVISRRFIKSVKNYKLETLTNFLNLPSVGYHDAMEDVIATSNLLIYLVNNPIKETKEQRTTILKKYLNLFNKLTLLLEKYKKKLHEKNFYEFVKGVVKDLDMEAVYNNQKSQLFNIQHFIKLSKLLANNNVSNYSCLKNVVNLASLSTNDFDAIYKEHKLIPIITVHQSKGCEFDTVYMPFVESNTYPNFYSHGQDDEEKRVFYVAITRAKKRLTISYSKTRLDSYFHPHNVYPSPYLKLFDERYINFDKMK